MNNRFLLVPNHSITIESDSLKMEYAEINMLNHVRSQCTEIAVTAFKTTRPNSSLTGTVKARELKLHALSIAEHETSILNKLSNYIYTILALPFVIAKYDFIYIFSPGHCGFFAAIWARLLRKKYGIYVRNTWLNKKGQTSLWWKIIFSGAQFMIVTGESFRKRLLQYCHKTENEVPLTALTPDQVPPSPAKRSVCTLLFVGRLFESKGILDVIRAVALLKGRGHYVELLIAGGGIQEELQAIHQLQLQLGIGEQIKLLGHLSPADLGKTYQQSSIFVFPSYYGEGFPRVLYEAMMYSLPIVTCEMPGTEGFLINDENCIYCKPKNPEHIADCLQTLIEDDELARNISLSAKQEVTNLYNSFIDKSHPEQLSRMLKDLQ